MKKNYIARRRGTSVAAAALSFALVAPLAQPVSFADEAPAVVADEDWYAPKPAAPAVGGSGKAIYSPGQASQKGTISGSVKEIVEARVGFGNVQDSGNPIAGVKVYAQWYEGVKTQHSSPVYYTESDENGNFTINMAPYVDANGETRTFRADGSVGAGAGSERDHAREKIRIWTELPEDKVDQYRLVYQPAAGIFPGIGSNTTPSTQGDGAWGGNKITDVAIQYAQKDKLPQHLSENQWSENAGRNNNHGVYQGRAFWNLDVLQGALNHNSVSAFGGKDIAAPGLKVVGSYLSDEAVTKIHEYAKNNFAGKTLRGKGWTAADEQGLQKWINEQVAADPQGWIAETVTTTTGADGTFHLYWKGLYGNSYTGTGGGINPPAEKLHKLAGSWDEGSWANGNSQSKHVNMHWSYVSVYDKDGNPLPDNIGVLYPWALGQWAGPGFGANLNAGGNAQLFGGDGVKILDGDDVYSGWNVALVPQALKFDVVEKNTTDNWATIGDTVQTDTSGLPITEDLNYYVEWFDKDGKSVKRCDLFKVDDATKIPSCELAVPADAQTGDTFTARLKVTEGEPADDDLVLAMDAFAVTRAYLAYDEKPAVKGEEATSAPKFDNPATEDEETKPENAVFELGKLPEGVKSDQVEVDPKTGVVTFKPTAEQVGKTFTFPVVMRDEDLQVPVYDENGAPVLDDQGNQKTQGRVVARGEAPFKVAAAKDADKYDPKGQDQSVKVGETPDPKKNIENVGDLPEGTKYEYKETPDTKTPGEKKVTVVVTYPDGSKDEVETTVTVTETPKIDAERFVPEYDKVTGVPVDGEKNTNDPFGKKAPVKDVVVTPTEGSDADKWTFTPQENGVINAKAPSMKDVAEKIDTKLPEIKSTEAGKKWDKFVEELTPFARPSVDVDFTYNDESKNKATAGFDLVGKDGKSLLDPDGDFDGDGISNKDEIEKGTNPADAGESRDTIAPLINPVKPGDRRITGRGDRPGEDISVTIPGVKDPNRTTTDKDGNWSVDVPTDVDLNPEDRIRVTDEAGNTTETTVEPAAPEPPLTDQFDPVYPRAYVRVGESATSVTPNLTRYVNGREFRRQPLRTAGDVTFKVESPGTLKNNGRVEVTAPKDAQPGDLITVPVLVTYADGTTDTTEAIFEVIPGAYAEMYDPKYEVGRSASPGEQTQVKQVGDNDLPEGTTFTLDRDKSDLNGWGIQVDEATGLITATAPQSRERRAEVVVTVSYADGSQQSITAFVDPQSATSMAETIPVKDALVTVPVGVALDANVVPALPDGTTFDIGAFSDENWSVDVNKDTGEVTVVTTDKVQPNDQVVVPVVVKFPDGSETTVNVTVVATKPQTTQHQPVYVASKVAPGERTSLRLEVPLDKKVGATYSLAGNAAGLQAQIDPETGVITVQADAGAKPGTRVLPVDVRYADGSVERIQARVEVTGTGVTANPACDDGSSNSSTSSTSSESCTTGSSTGGVIAIILGVLAVISGAAWAAFINQDAVRDVLRNFGIKF